MRGWGEEVAALGLPLTLNHNDLHARNAFVTGDGLRFFDFGDAVVTDPLGVLCLPVLRSWPTTRRPAPTTTGSGSSRTPRWRCGATSRRCAELRAALPAALQLGQLARVESWTRSLPSMNAAELADFGQHPVSWLASLTEDAPVRY